MSPVIFCQWLTKVSYLIPLKWVDLITLMLLDRQNVFCWYYKMRVALQQNMVNALPVIETMLSSLLMVCGLMSLNQSSVTSSLVRSKDICLVMVLCICRRRYVSWTEYNEKKEENQISKWSKFYIFGLFMFPAGLARFKKTQGLKFNLSF